jgi:uncharacterized protein YbaR (Trm112 family)
MATAMTATRTMPEWVRPALRCPQCKGPLADAPGQLVCQSCRLAYPVRDGIPSLLAGRAQPWPASPDAGAVAGTDALAVAGTDPVPRTVAGMVGDALAVAGMGTDAAAGTGMDAVARTGTGPDPVAGRDPVARTVAVPRTVAGTEADL